MPGKRRKQPNTGKSVGKGGRPKKQRLENDDEESTDPFQRGNMTEAELREWTNYYKSPDSLEEFLRGQCTEYEQDMLEDFFQRLATMAHCMHDYQRFYNACYEDIYRWEHRAPTGSTPAGDTIDLDAGHRLVLCIKDLLGQWNDWIYVAKSQYSGLGVFAARDFPAGGMLGMYIGPVLWQADTVGTPVPSLEVMKEHGISDEICNCLIRTAEGRMVLFGPRRIQPTIDPLDLYFGMHYAKGSEEDGVPPGQANCRIEEDGIVLASRAFRANQELVVASTR